MREVLEEVKREREREKEKEREDGGMRSVRRRRRR